MSARVGASLALTVAVACGAPEAPPPLLPQPMVPDARLVPDAAPPDAGPRPIEWLHGSTHVHAAPSGDSQTPIPDVIAWYEQRGYDFIVLTDHNRVSEVDADTAGHAWVRWPREGLIVLAGSELTYNPETCDPPPPEPKGKCRLHMNVIGATARPPDKLDWPARDQEPRMIQFERAIALGQSLGGLLQLNHPTWHWGTSPTMLAALARRGVALVEIANRQFERWNVGTDVYLGAEALWDAALATGVTIWGVASDDAHHHFADGSGKYPAGGAWIVVRARREPDAIVAAIAAGEFYASTGVELAQVSVSAGALVVEIADVSPGDHVIRFIHDGQPAGQVVGRLAARPVPATGYLRAVVDRADGARAWVQPVRGSHAP